MPDDDIALLRRYAEEHSEEAFAELVRRQVNLVYHAALRQTGGDTTLAEDATQVVFTDLARKARSLLQRPVITGWLYTSTRFAATKAKRTERRRQTREQEAHLMHELTHDSAAATDWERLRPVIDDALHALDERDREAVLLRFFEGRPFAEVGAKLSLSEDTARVRVGRALDKMRALLARRGVNSTTAALAVALANQAGVAAPAGLAAAVTGAALAGATGVGAAVNFLIFMSTTKIIAGISGFVALLAVGAAVFEANAARESAVVLASADREREALHAEVRQMAARTREAERTAGDAVARSAALQKGIEASRAATVAARPGANATALDPAAAKLAQLNADRQQLKMLNMTNPDFQRLMLQSQKAGMPLRFGALYRSLGLTSAQIASFEACMTEAQQSVTDVLNVASEKGVSPADPAMVALANEAKVRQEERLHALLGDAGFQEYQLYDRSAAARDMVGRMAGSLVASETPLTIQQLNGLAQIIAANNATFQKGGVASGNARDVNWDAAIEQARGVLSPDQLGVLQAMRDQTKTAAQIEDFARAFANAQAAALGAGPAGSPTPPKP